MLKMPNAMALNLMLAMMQSQSLSGASTPWSTSSPLSPHNFFPWLPKPKTPLEQGIDAAKTLWQNQSEQLQQLSEAWLKNLNPPSKPNPSHRKTNSNRSSFQSTSDTERRGSWFSGQSTAPNAGNATDDSAASFTFPDMAPWMSAFAGMTNEGSFAEFFDPAFLTSLGTQAYNQSTGFLQGFQAYLASDYTPPEKDYDVLWSRGSAQLFDLAPDRTDSVAVLCIPSLINSSRILDLTPETSTVDYLHAHGLRPLILDWGTPGDDETDFTTADYITAYALDALQTLRDNHDGPIVVLGYCMGGIFSVAMAQLAPLFVDALILLATPWDFSAPDTPVVLLNPANQLMLRQWIGSQNPVAPMVTQSIFHMIDPWRVQEKYQRYPTLDDGQKQQFLAVEHWVNDGVPIAQAAALECFVDWPQSNILATHQWKVGRRWIEPETVKQPTLAIMPSRDPIVPLGCARPLAAQLPRCDVIEPDTGHVSMLVGSRARELVLAPMVAWIKGKF